MITSKFETEIAGVRVGAKIYRIDGALLPALRHVPRELLPPLLEVLERDLVARHKVWARGLKRSVAWRMTWMDEAIRLMHRGNSYANIGRILESKGRGGAERIARTLARYVGRKK